jgi:hypothetical protein
VNEEEYVMLYIYLGSDTCNSKRSAYDRFIFNNEWLCKLMKINGLIRFLVLLGCCASMQTMALPAVNPYQGLVLAEGSSEDQLKQAAFDQVLVKVSGNQNISEVNGRSALDKNIPNMLSQFGYKNVDDMRFYYAVFDKQKVDNALIGLQQPIWGEIRPTTLIWLVNQDRKFISESAINSSDDTNMAWGLSKAQLQRGIKMQFPLIDLDDSIAVSATDVSGRFYQNVAEGSRRYNAEYVVLANIKPSGDSWELTWELVSGGKNNVVLLKNANNGDKEELMSAMVNEIADYYAQQFATKQTVGSVSASTQLVTIKNIQSLDNMMILKNVLNDLNDVDNVEVMSINGTEVQLLVTLKGSVTGLENALNAQPSLQRDLMSTTPFYYNWQP